MADLSRISQTILDYATSGAKRSWSKTVNDLHLVVAIRRWDEKWFDQEFPGIAEQLNRLLEARKGDCLKPESVESSVLQHLEGVTHESDLQDLVRILVADLQRELEAAPDEAPARSHEVREHRTAEENETRDVDIPSHSEEKRLLLSDTLVHKIATILGVDSRQVLQTVACDARVLAARVLDREDEMIVSALFEALNERGNEPSGRELSDLIHRVAQVQDQDGSRVATLLALAYVDVAEFAASLDDQVTEQEIEMIDSIRLECREMLDSNIDATSDAIIEFEQRFGELVGMEEVKRDLRKRVDFLSVAKRRAMRGQSTEIQRMHMAFVGNPGTGKTTVARLFGQLLNKLGLLQSDIFVEKDRSGLVGTHVGHTEEKTRNAIRDADGGVLFIDEAYALNDRYGNQKGFGEEALDVLVKEMEDKRDRLVVILAGYKGPMENFLTVNPGLKSRIPSIINFPDYSVSELLEIADRIAYRRGLTIENNAKEKIRLLMDGLSKVDGFGNARDVENVMDAAQRNLTMRLSPLGNLATDRESRTIIASDVSDFEQAEKTRHIGFGRHLYI